MKAARRQTQRHEFPGSTKTKLAMRVAHLCSNPKCRISTVGPATSPDGVASIGKAAHICAAAPGGPRYDSNMSPQERSGIDNGIWLCANHADEIDRDPNAYPVGLLKEWKREAEQIARKERGLAHPSARELALFKSNVLGENVTGESADAMIRGSMEIAKRELENADPRLTVAVNADDSGVKFTFHPNEDIPFRLHVDSEGIEEFSSKLSDLHRHGDRLEIAAKHVTLSGSPIFDRIGRSEVGKFVLDAGEKQKALARLSFERRDHTGSDSVEMIGEVKSGSETLTFNGTSFGGIHELSFRAPLSGSGKVDVEVGHFFTFQSWEGKPVDRLPYLDRMADLIDAGASGQRITMCLEIEGVTKLKGDSTNFVTKADLSSIAWLLDYLKVARDLCRRLSISVPFRVDKIHFEDAREAKSLWNILCGESSLRGTAIPELNANYRC